MPGLPVQGGGSIPAAGLSAVAKLLAVDLNLNLMAISPFGKTPWLAPASVGLWRMLKTPRSVLIPALTRKQSDI